MKYIKSINEISGYDRWKTQSPYDNEVDCESEGYLDADITFNINKSVDSDDIDGNEFESFCNDVNRFLIKYFKGNKSLSKLKAVSPVDTNDESYQDWKDNGDGTFSIGMMAWKVTGDFGPIYASNIESTAEEILPGAKDFQQLVKKYKWIDPKRIWVEDVESEIDNPCD